MTATGYALEQLREKRPLIHAITNVVTINDVANLLLACGARPIMANAPEEVEEITALADGLVLNLGTPNLQTISSMFLSGKKANALGIPVVLDPVGVGASRLRRETAARLLQEVRFSVIRGNISEIRALAEGSGCPGVDADAAQQVTEENLTEALDFAGRFARHTGAVVAVSGALDLVCDGSSARVIRNGRQEMSLVTGTGCQLSALVGAFAAANRVGTLDAVAAAVAMMGLAGELGWERMAPGDGNASYRSRIIDAVCTMTPQVLEKGARIESR
ncbi:hydroxyethylthiazole kinase [Angelakisella massiliensis]|uniref:hydroxyethylthiazole kinase n=1 Tax=Angelakisella massiliensis TaxID=1871018 RepID=UPI0008F8F6EB|nr:hydroxyethylthiazole kinase [Angelakisella massiliensis]